ncbi:uncharacterized protein METZ01_LOCUS327256, partial [marine metagenome]
MGFLDAGHYLTRSAFSSIGVSHRL